MDITPLVPQGTKIIQGYSNGQFRISGAVYTGPVIVTPDSVVSWGGGIPITQAHFSDFKNITGQADVILVGCGATCATIPLVLRQQVKSMGLHAEWMDTGAACRTFNVLLTEGRRVAAALIPNT